MIKTIIFDMGKVLLDYDARKAGLRFATACKVPFLKVWAHFFTSQTEKAYTRGEISTREFYDHAKEALHFPVDLPTFKHYWNDIFTEIPEMNHLLKSLKKKYPLYLISNTNELHFDHVKKEFPHILKHFKKTFPSHKMGCRKPDPKIFRNVLKAIKFKAEETVFIDDVQTFLDGAKLIGMNTIRFRNPKQLIRDLKKLGVEI